MTSTPAPLEHAEEPLLGVEKQWRSGPDEDLVPVQSKVMTAGRAARDRDSATR